MDSMKRSFIIGSEWLYYKIYTGVKTSDVILADIIKPVTEQLISEGIIDKWFFIRYADPKHHIRVRFHYSNPENVAVLINALNEAFTPLIEEDVIWKMQADTYQREIERYGESTMVSSETLFFHESKMISEFLDLIDGDEGEELRWLFGVRAIDSLLGDFKFTEDDKLKLLENLHIGFGNEFGMNRFLKKQLEKKFRVEKDKMKTFLDFKTETAGDYKPLLEILERKSKNTLTTVSTILDDIKEVTLNNLMGSYIHMLMNRLFRSKNRLHEMVVYDLLYRHYKVQWGIRKYKNKG